MINGMEDVSVVTYVGKVGISVSQFVQKMVCLVNGWMI